MTESAGNHDTILVGVDGSEDGLRAVRYGIVAATGMNCRLRLVHAVDDAILAGAWGVVYDPTILQNAGEEATKAALDLVDAEGFPSDRVTAEVVLGNAAAVLSRLSKDARLLVVGRRSVSGLERMFVGSTSVSVGSTSHCPVIVISMAANPGPTGGFHTIAVGVDARSHSDRPLKWALQEARQRGAKLKVIHVVKAVPGSVPEAQLAAAKEGIKAMLAGVQQDFADVPVDIEVHGGNPVDVLVTRSASVDLLVLGVRPPTVIGFSVGGVDRGVLAHAQSPLALVR
ncbi:MAG TPA: universal stress protein [Propionibacteriaceae bacterium]|nr:universal stress protein [Propionibacteriaceae bacterium]